MPDRTLIVSATNVVARGYLVVPTDRVSTRGEPVNGVFALSRALLRAISFKQPAPAIAVIDASAPLPQWPDLLKQQVPAIAPLLAAHGIRAVTAPDELGLVASYAEAALAAGDDVVIVGTDKRYAQLVGDRLWWYDANKDAR